MKKPQLLSIVSKQKWAAYQKLCQRLQKKWQNRTWHKLNISQKQHWIKRLHRYEFQLQKLGIAATFSLAFLGLSPTDIAAQTLTPIGSEFQANTYTTGNQINPSIAMDNDGDFVITWHNRDNQDGDNTGVFAQRYNRNGVAQGSEFQVNTYTTHAQSRPSVAMDSDGDFVIAWQSFNQDGHYYGIYAQRYSSNGATQGGEFQVNTFTTDQQALASVAMDSDGDFVIAWLSRGDHDGDGSGVFARQYNNSGIAQGPEIQVNTYTTGAQFGASVAMDNDGDFVVAWISYDQDGDISGVYAQRYDKNGTKEGGELSVNSYTTGYQGYPSVGMDNDGDFVIAWESGIYDVSGQDGSYFGIYARKYNNAGTPIGGEFQVNTYTTNYQRYPAVGMDNDGDFVITWQSGYYDGVQQDGDALGVYAQKYDKSGAVVGEEFQVNTYTTQSQGFVDIGMDGDGDFVIAWESGDSQDGSNYGIFAQRYDSAEPVPTLSEWGLLNLALLLMICGTLYLLQPTFQRQKE